MLLDFNLTRNWSDSCDAGSSKEFNLHDEEFSPDEDEFTFLEPRSPARKNSLLFLRLTGETKSGMKAYTVSNDLQLLTVSPVIVGPVGFEKTTDKCFRFTKIFNGQNSEINPFLQGLQQHVVDQTSFAVLSYGYSCPKNTCTMLSDKDQAGIIPCVLEQMFRFYEGKISQCPTLKFDGDAVTHIGTSERAMDLRRIKYILERTRPDQERLMMFHQKPTLRRKSTENCEVMIWVSLLNFQNEFAYDMLTRSVADDNEVPLRFTQTLIEGSFQKMSQVYVKNTREALCVLAHGLKAAASKPTENNSLQLMFCVNILKKFRNGEIAELAYKFCDLVPPKLSTCTDGAGILRSDNSLETLKRCLFALEAAKTRKIQIPVRESTLTSFLEPAIMGAHQLFIMSCIDTKKDVDENMKLLESMFTKDISSAED